MELANQTQLLLNPDGAENEVHTLSYINLSHNIAEDKDLTEHHALLYFYMNFT